MGERRSKNQPSLLGTLECFYGLLVELYAGFFNLDGLRRAYGDARHAPYAIMLSYGVGLVSVVLSSVPHVIFTNAFAGRILHFYRRDVLLCPVPLINLNRARFYACAVCNA